MTGYSEVLCCECRKQMGFRRESCWSAPSSTGSVSPAGNGAVEVEVEAAA